MTLTLILGRGSAVKKYFFQDYEKRKKKDFFTWRLTQASRCMPGPKREFSIKAK